MKHSKQRIYNILRNNLIEAQYLKIQNIDTERQNKAIILISGALANFCTL